MKADTMGRIKTRLRMVEEFAKLVDDAEARGDTTVNVPLVLAMVAAGCARNGVRPRQGRGGAVRSRKAESAREIAMKEARERGLLRRHRAEAKAMGRFNPLSWARKETANVVYQRMKDLGVAHPPAIETIMKWKF
ncbi:MAG: hypothetical protein WBX37_16965 [Pseudolabrys sp.]